MNFMRPLFILLLMISSTGLAADTRPTVTLEGKKAELVVDLGGGSISEFRLKPNGMNPLEWDSWSFSPHPGEEPPITPRSMGHFLCLDRWGSASEAEKAHGMNQHGEATQVWWAVSHEMTSNAGKMNLRLRADLPVAGLHVERSIFMHESSTVAVVEEQVTNTNKIGRIYNMVQHPATGGPFLDAATIVDTNATRGFMQGGSMPNPEDPEVQWPIALREDGTEVDIRFLKDPDHSPNVVSFIVEEEYGWVTATSPGSGLLIGYIWRASDYPWVNIWRHVMDGKPFARGLEFGTTGLHKPGHDLVAKGSIFDQPLYRYIDADETQSFKYAMFLMEVPEGFAGVKNVIYKDSIIHISEAGTGGRQIKIEAYSLF